MGVNPHKKSVLPPALVLAPQPHVHMRVLAQTSKAPYQQRRGPPATTLSLIRSEAAPQAAFQCRGCVKKHMRKSEEAFVHTTSTPSKRGWWSSVQPAAGSVDEARPRRGRRTNAMRKARPDACAWRATRTHGGPHVNDPHQRAPQQRVRQMMYTHGTYNHRWRRGRLARGHGVLTGAPRRRRGRQRHVPARRLAEANPA